MLCFCFACVLLDYIVLVTRECLLPFMLCLLSEYISESDCQHELDQPTVLFVSILKRWIWMWSDLLETEIHSWTFTDKRFNMYSRKQLHFQIHFLLSLVDMLMCNILDSRYFRTWGDFRSPTDNPPSWGEKNEPTWKNWNWLEVIPPDFWWEWETKVLSEWFMELYSTFTPDAK